MEYIVNGSQAREIDRCSIQEIGIPSMVLMEKAAMSVASCIMAQADKSKTVYWLYAGQAITVEMVWLLRVCCGMPVILPVSLFWDRKNVAQKR